LRDKKSLRKEILSLLAGQSAEERDRKSLAIQEKLFRHPFFRKADTVCFFVSLPREVDTHPMIERALAEKKKVLVPRVDLENKELKLKEVRDLHRDLMPGVLGILEPQASAPDGRLDQIGCLIVPALAFDEKGYRLGRGGGFYDRLLSKLPVGAHTIGLGFSFQLLDSIPLEDHDRAVESVLTED
jgi:5-formyltetrahydrofolate cyclo-ligase